MSNMLPGVDPICVIRFTLPGPPKSWDRPGRKGGRYYKSSAKKKLYSRIRDHFDIARLKSGAYSTIPWPHDGPAYIHATAFFELPKSWNDWRMPAALAGKLPCERKSDADNILKAVADALEKTAWSNDKRIWAMAARKHWALPGKARTEIALYFYPEIKESNYGI